MSSESSEAKQIPHVTDDQNGPSVGVLPAQPADPEIFAEKLPISSISPEPTGSSDSDEIKSRSVRPPFLERAASFLFKVGLIGVVFFAIGATIVITVLMDLLDLKTGWIKSLLQFIKDASEIIK